MRNGKGTACLRDEKSKLTYKEKEATLTLSQSSDSSQAKAYALENGIPLTQLWQPALAVWPCLGRQRELYCRETCVCWQLSMPQWPREQRQEGYRNVVGVKEPNAKGWEKDYEGKNDTNEALGQGEPKVRTWLPGTVAAQPHASPPLYLLRVVLRTQSSPRLFQHTTLSCATVSFSFHQETALGIRLPHLWWQHLQVRSKGPQSSLSEDRLE